MEEDAVVLIEAEDHTVTAALTTITGGEVTVEIEVAAVGTAMTGVAIAAPMVDTTTVAEEMGTTIAVKEAATMIAGEEMAEIAATTTLAAVLGGIPIANLRSKNSVNLIQVFPRIVFSLIYLLLTRV